MTQIEAVVNVSTVLKRAIDSGAIAGALVHVRRHGEVVHHAAHGQIDALNGRQLLADSVFWLASLTKPVIAAAVLQLKERGRLELRDPVSRFVPEFARARSVRVWRSGTVTPPPPTRADLSVVIPNDPPHSLEPAQRELTLVDLLTHTSGLQTIGVPNSAIPAIGPSDTLASFVPRLAEVPLDFQPGRAWAYSNAMGFDVLARVVEVAAEQSLPDFLADNVFGPLAMRDSGFGLRGHPRAWPVDARFEASPVIAGKHYFSGAAGLWSCASDYARFGEMLRNGGQLEGVRVLQADSVAQMSRNHVAGLFAGLMGRPHGGGMGFGLGVACVVDRATSGGVLPEGSFGWDGIGTRRFWVMPALGLVLVMYVPSASVQVEVEAAVVNWAAAAR